MSLWFFNMLFDRVVRRVNERVEGRRLKLRDGSEREWETKQIIYAEDIVLLAESRENFQQFVNKCERACDMMILKINVGKSKVLVVRIDQRTCGERV